MSAVLAIDPSLAHCAVVVAFPDAPWHSQRIETKAASGVLHRVLRYRKIARPIVELARQHRPAIILIEGYSFGSDGPGDSERKELGGVLRDRLAALAPILEVPPTTLKKWATGKGNADKTAVATALALRFGRAFANNDESDAWALAALGTALLEPELVLASYTKPQREVAERLLEPARQLRDAHAALLADLASKPLEGAP